MSNQQTRAINFLSGGGEMGRLTRGFNWGDSPLGNPDEWPLSLLTTLSTILSSKFPMFLWWGEAYVQFYNDAYRPSLGHQGKHPRALGQRGQDCWEEVWPIIQPLIDQVLAGGESIWGENGLLPINRNGQLEDVYWTASYSAVRLDSGQIGGVLVVCQETTQLVMTHQKLHQSELRYRTIVEHAPLGIALLSGRKMIIDLANESMYNIWRKDSSVIGRSLFEVQPELREQRFIDLLEAVYDTGVPYFGRGELARLNRDGSLQDAYFNFVYTPLFDTIGAVMGVQIMATEVTAEKENERILHQSLQREQELSQLKSRFVSIASHEFRTPLTAISSSIELVKHYAGLPEVGPVSSFIQKHADQIFQQVLSLNELIGDTLTLGKIEEGNIQLLPDETDLPGLVQALIGSTFSERKDGRQVVWFVEGHPVKLQLDKKLFRAVLANLLSNAFKYSTTNPQVLIQFTPQAVRVAVSDGGLGIPKGDLPFLFSKFFRASNVGHIKGTGLGLAICQEYMYLLGGGLT